MSLAILYPRFVHPAVEERYGSAQTRLLLAGGGHEVILYDPEAPLADARPGTTHAVVVVDPLLLPSSNLPRRLVDLLDATPGAEAALPISNEAERPEQRRAPPAAYLTLDELQAVTAFLERQPRDARRLLWDGAHPGVFACRAALLAGAVTATARAVLAGREVVLSATDYVHRFATLRGGMRDDMLARIAPDAAAVLEIGCGEGLLGQALKRRQPCRVVGVELDAAAAAVAAGRLDAVHQGDARALVHTLHDRGERFDWIVGADVVEHVDDPWTFLTDLRRLAGPGGRLLLSLPNAANGALVAALLRGRLDYVYMGLTCAGHLHFFTRRGIRDMLQMSGWTLLEMTPQEGPVTTGARELKAALGPRWSPEEHEPVGFTVLAQSAS